MTEKPEFPAFPYKPYSIQIYLMNALYQFLDKGGVSMLENPTGTGKSLSIICSALQWLIDRKEKGNSESDKVDGNDGEKFSYDEPDWMRNFSVLNEDDRASDDKNSKSSPFRLLKEPVPQVFSNPTEGDISVKKHEAELRIFVGRIRKPREIISVRREVKEKTRQRF